MIVASPTQQDSNGSHGVLVNRLKRRIGTHGANAFVVVQRPDARKRTQMTRAGGIVGANAFGYVRAMSLVLAGSKPSPY